MARIERSLCYAVAVLAAVSPGCGERPPKPSAAETPGAAPPDVRRPEAVREAAREAVKATEAPPGDEEEVPAGDPRAVFLAAQGAMKGRKFGTLFDLLAKTVQEKFDADLRADAEASAGAPFVKDVLGFDPRECGKLPPREAFVKVMEGGTRSSEELARGVGAKREIVPQIAEAKVVAIDVEGEAATVTVEYGNRSKGEVRLVLQHENGDGKWRLAELPWIVGTE